MTQQTNPNRHKHADLIHAWAEGAEIQFLNAEYKWMDVQGYPSWLSGGQYRIKPKLVKKWKWVVEVNYYTKPTLSITEEHYSSEEEFKKNKLYFPHDYYRFLEKLDFTEIEVEET